MSQRAIKPPKIVDVEKCGGVIVAHSRYFGRAINFTDAIVIIGHSRRDIYLFQLRIRPARVYHHDAPKVKGTGENRRG